MRRIVIIISLFLLALATSLMVSNVTFAQEKPTAALSPMGALGELDEIEKRIFFNSLQESLSKYYTLTSQKMYEKAEEEAFQVMDADECNEDQCIAIIQELLQVEYFFMYEILQSGNFQQMKITRVDIDGNRDVRTTTCEDCNISKTNSKVDDLVQSVFKEFEIQKENGPAAQLEGSGFGMGWKLSTLAVTLGAGMSALNQAKTYNDLAGKNKTLREQYSTANTPEERSSLETEYANNQKQMKSVKSSIRNLDVVTLVGVLALAYMFTADYEDPVRVVGDARFPEPARSGFLLGLLENHLQMGWRWNF